MFNSLRKMYEIDSVNSCCTRTPIPALVILCAKTTTYELSFLGSRINKYEIHCEDLSPKVLAC